MKNRIKILPPVFLIVVASAIIYFSWTNKPDKFSCVASVSQHYKNENIDISLRFIFRGQAGVVSISGRSKSDFEKVFNRKISFTVRKHQDIYYMISEKNIKFPDDNVNDVWLSQYEPDFFVYPNKSIHTRIEQQANGNYLFMISVLPTFICNAAN